MGIAGLGVMVVALVTAITLGVISSKWWHNRRHTVNRWPLTCDHCLHLWEDSSS